jgi:hypothetical protein
VGKQHRTPKRQAAFHITLDLVRVLTLRAKFGGRLICVRASTMIEEVVPGTTVRSEMLNHALSLYRRGVSKVVRVARQRAFITGKR